MVGFKCQDPKCQLSLICKQFGPYLQRGVQPIGNQRRCLQNGNDQFSGPVEQIFKWRGVKHEQTRGVWGNALQRNFKFKSSEMALNASKPANGNINL